MTILPLNEIPAYFFKLIPNDKLRISCGYDAMEYYRDILGGVSPPSNGYCFRFSLDHLPYRFGEKFNFICWSESEWYVAPYEGIICNNSIVLYAR